MTLEIGDLYPKQLEFCKATNKYVCYGGARGGGKSHVSRIKMCLLALHYSGIQILLLRRTLPELRENHLVPLQKMLKGIAVYRDSHKEFSFPNGSRIKLGYCATENDVLQYQGQAYEVIVLEEATMFTLFQYTTLTESNRLSQMMDEPFEPRMYFTCNPGGVGHAWVKRLFIDKDYKSTEKPEDYKFIPAVVYENQYLMENDPGYVEKLKNLPEDRRRAMLDGDWDVFEGQYFSEFRNHIHTIDPINIDPNWNKYITLDYGLDMLAVLWIAVDGQDNVYVYKELYESNLIISEACKRIKEVNGSDNVVCNYAPPDLWQRKSNTGEDSAEVFKQNGIKLTKSSNERIQGWYAVKEFLKVIKTRDEQTGEEIKTSKLKIFRNCSNLIRTLPMLQYDEKKPNDVSNQPHELTHINDALRGWCIERLRKPMAQPTDKERYAQQQYEQTVEAIAGSAPDMSFFTYK